MKDNLCCSVRTECVSDVPLHGGGMGDRTCSTEPVDDAAVITRGYSLAHSSKKRVAVV